MRTPLDRHGSAKDSLSPGAGGIGGLLARSSGYSSGNWSTHNYYFTDGNGNVTYLVNVSQTAAASYRYDPFGNLISSSGTLANDNVYRFSSKEVHVNSGMYYYGYRFYDPNLQRWISRDPARERGFTALETARPRSPNRTGGSDPGSSDRLHPNWSEVNLFTLAVNDPIDASDPLGLLPIRDWAYGNWCGWMRYGQSGGPIDELDTACEVHDFCLATPADFLNPCHFWNCNNTFCASAAAADCSKSPDPGCRSAQKDIAIACNAAGSGLAFIWGGISKQLR